MTADRSLDGHVSRVLEGKTVLAVAKDGRSMTIACTNGEQYHVAWADFLAGKAFAGEPAIVAIDDMKLAAGSISTPDGSVHGALAGKLIESARTDGKLLLLRCVGGGISHRYGIAWVDPKTGEQMSAEPCLVRVDARVKIEGVSVFPEPGM